MIIGASLFLRRKPDQKFGSRRSGRFILLIGLFLSIVAYAIVQICAVVPNLPRSSFSARCTVLRPWDAMPLILYMFAGGIFLCFDHGINSLTL